MKDNFWWPNDEAAAKKMLKECRHVFVYGTLKAAYGNNRLLDNTKPVGPAVTCDGFALGKSGCPYAFPKDVVPEEYHTRLIWPIKGELYKIDARDYRTAADLDILESYPSFYNRRVVLVECDEITYSAWIYTIEDPMWMRRVDACHLDNGHWVY